MLWVLSITGGASARMRGSPPYRIGVDRVEAAERFIEDEQTAGGAPDHELTFCATPLPGSSTFLFHCGHHPSGRTIP
ncbi:MAG: hypothetical protein IPK99_05890 [Flavobacteriales bacterium]|nr:hypothetical protein [Flavobacteriales bacterium]